MKWAIRFLNGQLAGQILPLQEGRYILGRGEDCQIVVPDEGISKKHAALEVDEQGVFIQDLKSSNGTFINGVKIQESDIQKKERVSVCKTTFDIVNAEEQQSAALPAPAHHLPPPAGGAPGMAPYAYPAPYMPAGAIPPAGQAPQNKQSPPEEPVKLTLKNWFKNT